MVGCQKKLTGDPVASLLSFTWANSELPSSLARGKLARDNPLWGAPRIHGELLKLGIDIAQSTVAKYMSRRYGPRSPGWRTFLRNHTAHIAGIDLFVVPTVGFKLPYFLVILLLNRRRLDSTNVTANPNRRVD